MRGLIGKLPLQEIKTVISQIQSHYGFWPDAVEKVNDWLYFNRREAPENLGKAVRAYFDELMPSEAVGLAVLYTHAWHSDFHDPDVDYQKEEFPHIDFEYATRKAIELAEVIANDPALTDRALERFVVSDGKTGLPLARRLAELAPSATNLFKTALEKAELRQEAANWSFSVA